MAERDELRRVFFESWRKYKEKLPLTPLETQLANLILLHPEYHSLLEDPHTTEHHDFIADNNPFLHLSLHLALQEQIATDRPAGIKKIYGMLNKKYNDDHLVAHKMLDCLAQILWEAQQTMQTPDEKKYFESLKALLL